MAPEDNPKDLKETYPCDCGGEITKEDGCSVWHCNICGWTSE